MASLRRVVWGFALVVGAALVICVGTVAVFLWTHSPCGNRVELEVPSGHGMRAVAFQRDCGATTGFSTQVSILPMGDPLENEPGNVFIVDGVRRVIELRWHGPKALSIRVAPWDGYRNPDPYLKEERLEGIEIKYP